ncbi:hypothetical protein QGM71_21440 [Virgibacillus sp. C22-A2]|uniref:Uncharacterized protein n=1 Tax=Virgibacillus tibetensis TaxID=3042313 RepID=A0ABU6KLK1_9BACI|nr:hypothetical protein [Virgibacillus sp. C22-A2]
MPITHGIGAVLSTAGLILLILFSARSGKLMANSLCHYLWQYDAVHVSCLHRRT